MCPKSETKVQQNPSPEAANPIGYRMVDVDGRCCRVSIYRPFVPIPYQQILCRPRRPQVVME